MVRTRTARRIKRRKRIMVRVVCLLIGYVFGLFQTSYFISKSRGFDIRDFGSGNAGTTNVFRTIGIKPGLMTFIGDSLKCLLAICHQNMPPNWIPSLCWAFKKEPIRVAKSWP